MFGPVAAAATRDGGGGGGVEMHSGPSSTVPPSHRRSVTREAAAWSATGARAHLWLTDLFAAMRAHALDGGLSHSVVSSDRLRGCAPTWTALTEKSGLFSSATSVPVSELLLWLAPQPVESVIGLLVEALLPAMHRLQAPDEVSIFAATAQRATWLLISGLFDAIAPATGDDVSRILSLPLLQLTLKDWWAIEAKHTPSLLLSLATERGGVSKEELYLWWSTDGCFEFRKRCSLRGSLLCGHFLFFNLFQSRLRNSHGVDESLSNVSLRAFMAVFTFFYPTQIPLQRRVEIAFKKRQAAVADRNSLDWSDIIALLLKDTTELFRKGLQYVTPLHATPRGSPRDATTHPSHPAHADTSEQLHRYLDDERSYCRHLLQSAAATHDRIRKHIQGDTSILSFDSFVSDLLSSPGDVAPSPLRVLRVVHTLRFVAVLFLEQKDWTLSLREFTASFLRAIEHHSEEIADEPVPKKKLAVATTPIAALTPTKKTTAIQRSTPTSKTRPRPLATPPGPSKEDLAATLKLDQTPTHDLPGASAAAPACEPSAPLTVTPPPSPPPALVVSSPAAAVTPLAAPVVIDEPSVASPVSKSVTFAAPPLPLPLPLPPPRPIEPIPELEFHPDLEGLRQATAALRREIEFDNEAAASAFPHSLSVADPRRPFESDSFGSFDRGVAGTNLTSLDASLELRSRSSNLEIFLAQLATMQEANAAAAAPTITHSHTTYTSMQPRSTYRVVENPPSASDSATLPSPTRAPSSTIPVIPSSRPARNSFVSPSASVLPRSPAPRPFAAIQQSFSPRIGPLSAPLGKRPAEPTGSLPPPSPKHQPTTPHAAPPISLAELASADIADDALFVDMPLSPTPKTRLASSSSFVSPVSRSPHSSAVFHSDSGTIVARTESISSPKSSPWPVLVSKPGSRLHDPSPIRPENALLGPGEYAVPLSSFGTRGASMAGPTRAHAIPGSASLGIDSPGPGAYDSPSSFSPLEGLPSRKNFGEARQPRSATILGVGQRGPQHSLKGHSFQGRYEDKETPRRNASVPGPGAHDLPSTLSPTPAALVRSRLPEVLPTSASAPPPNAYDVPEMFASRGAGWTSKRHTTANGHSDA